jgi:hypothetical protein
MHRFRPENTFSHSLARAKSDEGGHLATLANIDSTTLEQGNGSILVSRPGSILASAEAPKSNPLPIFSQILAPRQTAFTANTFVLMRRTLAIKMHVCDVRPRAQYIHTPVGMDLIGGTVRLFKVLSLF